MNTESLKQPTDQSFLSMPELNMNKYVTYLCASSICLTLQVVEKKTRKNRETILFVIIVLEALCSRREGNQASNALLDNKFNWKLS